MDGLIALVYARKLYDLAEGPQGPPGQDGEVTNAALEEKLEAYAKLDGSYESMTVGNAEQLVSNVRVNDKTPYLFRTSGGSVDIGDREYVNGIVGGTVAFNQLNSASNNRSRSVNGLTFTNNNDGSVSVDGTCTATDSYSITNVFSVVASHKYYICGVVSTANYSITHGNVAISPIGTDGAVISPSGEYLTINLMVTNGATLNIKVYPQLFDLTQMFGSTIADYIYSLETANAGAGVAWFKKLFNKPYYAYNAGELKSVSGLVSHDMRGFNAWDEELEDGNLNTTTGAKEYANNYFRTKNFIPVLPNTTYYYKAPTSSLYARIYQYDADYSLIKYVGTSQLLNRTFTTESNARYIKFTLDKAAYGSTYNHDICINISWDGSRDGEYEPYELHSYPLDSDLTLRGIPKLDANNELYYDGDVYEADGTVTRKYGIVDLGSLSWSRYTNNESFHLLYAEISDLVVRNGANGICKAYPLLIGNDYYWSDLSDKQGVLYIAGTSKRIGIRDESFTDVASFTTAMSGVYLVYELATPTTETADPYQQVQICNDFGTEEYVLDDSAFPVPVGHDTDYPVNLVAKLEMAPNSPEGNGDYIVRQVNGENSYVPLVIEDALPTIPSTAGSYKLTVTVAEGSDPVLSWEAE